MTKVDELENAIQKGGIIRAADFPRGEVPPVYFTRLVRAGRLIRLAPGVYIGSDFAVGENAVCAMVARIAPRSVVCLFSALKVHELTDENPHRIHLAIPSHTRLPKMSFAADVYYMGEKSFEAGIEEKELPIGSFRVYSVEKTLVDLFKFRNRVGLDVAQRAIKEAYEKGRIDNNKLWEMAEICRMTRIMRPYMEVLS